LEVYGLFGLGFWEIGVILVFSLLVLGPEKLPAVAKQLARIVKEVRRAAMDFQMTLNDSIDEEPQVPAIQTSKRLNQTTQAEQTPITPQESEHRTECEDIATGKVADTSHSDTSHSDAQAGEDTQDDLS
jgi:Tat protein translocase TatB subunit